MGEATQDGCFSLSDFVGFECFAFGLSLILKKFNKVFAELFSKSDLS